MKRKIIFLIAIAAIFLCLLNEAYSHFDYVGGRKIINAYKATIKKYLKIGSDSAATIDKSGDLYVEDDIEAGGDILGANLTVSESITLTEDKTIGWTPSGGLPEETIHWDATTHDFRLSDDLYVEDQHPGLVLSNTDSRDGYDLHYHYGAAYPLAFWYGTIDADGGFVIGNEGVPLWYFDSSHNFAIPTGNFQVTPSGTGTFDKLFFPDTTASYDEITTAVDDFTIQSVYSGASGDCDFFMLGAAGKSMYFEVAADGPVGWQPYLGIYADYPNDVIQVISDVNICLMPTSYVGIGTTAPSTELEVVGTGTFDALTITAGTQDYTFSGIGPELSLQSQTAGTGNLFRFFSKESDGTDTVSFALYAVGTPLTPADFENIILAWDSSNNEFCIRTGVGFGSGVVQPINIYTSGNRGQVLLNTDNSVTFGGSITHVDSVYVDVSVVNYGDAHTGIFFGSNDYFDLNAGGVRLLRIIEGTQDAVIVNEDGVDVDFRVEGLNDTHLLFTEASTDRVGIGTSAMDSLFEVDGAEGLAIEIVTGNTTLDNTHSTLLVNASGNVTITLPTSASSYNNADGIGRIYEIKKIDADADTVTVDGNGSETIDGGTTAVITTQFEAITIQADGSNWHII